MKNSFFIWLFLILNSTILLSQPVYLTPLNEPGGFSTKEFQINDFGEMLVIEGSGLLFYSPDRGNTWTEVIGNFRFNHIRLVENEFYLFGFDYVAKLIGSTGTVQEIYYNDDESIRDFLIDESGTMFVFFLDSDIVKSSDGGNTWTKIIDNEGTFTLGLKNTFTAIPNSDYLYVNISGNRLPSGVYMVKKDGTEQFMLDEIGSLAEDFCFHPSGKKLVLKANRNGILVSDNGVDGWIDITPNDWFTKAAFCTKDGDIVIRNQFGYYRTSDLGANWEFLAQPHFKSIYQWNNQIEYFEAGNSYYIQLETASSYTLFEVSEDFTNWSPVKLNEARSNPISIEFDSFQNVIVGTNHAMAKVISGGGYEHTTYYHYDSLFQIKSQILIKDTIAPFELKMGQNEVIFAFGEDYNLYKSEDKGLSWDLIPIPSVFFWGFRFLKAEPNGYLYIFNTSSNTLLFSPDNGLNWKQISEGQYFEEDEIFSDSLGFIYAVFDIKKFSRYTPTADLWETLYEDQYEVHPFITQTGQIIVNGSNNGSQVNYLYDGDFDTYYQSSFKSYDNIISTKNGYLFWNFRNDIFVSKNLGQSSEYLITAGENSNFITSISIDEKNRLWVGKRTGGLWVSNPLNFDDNFIVGEVFYDENENCLYDPLERFMPDQIVRAAGLDTFYINTRSDGKYFIPVPAGTYEVSTSVDPSLWEPCDSIQQVTFTGTSDSVYVDFAVKAKVYCPSMAVDLTTPRLRRCFPNNNYVKYCNAGTTTGDSAYIEIKIDSRFTIDSSSIPWTSEIDKTYTFPVGNVDIFDCGQFNFYTSMICDSVQLEETVCAEAHIFPDTVCASISTWSQATLQMEATCDGDSISFKVKNIGSGTMVQSRSFIIIEDVVIMKISPPFQLAPGEEFTDKIHADGKTYYAEIEQDQDHPASNSVGVAIERDVGILLTFLEFITSIHRTHQQVLLTSNVVKW